MTGIQTKQRSERTSVQKFELNRFTDSRSHAVYSHMTTPALQAVIGRLIEGKLLTSTPEVHGYWEEVFPSE